MRAAPVCRTPLVMTQNRVRTGTHRVRVVRVRRTRPGATMGLSETDTSTHIHDPRTDFEDVCYNWHT